MKIAYVTLLSGGDAYVPGAEVLGRSLARTGSTVPRIAMVTSDVDASARDALRGGGWELRDVEPIANPSPESELFPRFDRVFTKLRAWELTDLDRVVVLDADTLVLRPIDELFERADFAAAPDFFLPDRFNSGVMLLSPSQETFDRMVAALAASGSYDGGDQGFLNTFYPDWYAMPAPHRLPVGFNVPNFIFQFLRGHPTLRATLEREARVVHYLVQKPWKARSTLTGASEIWWDAYFLAHPEKARRWKERIHAAEDWTFDTLARWALE
jgi:alpha-N-acetylglucosamine transferase